MYPVLNCRQTIVNDRFRLEYFDSEAQRSKALSPAEKERIRTTIEMIPAHWRSIVDVGCGDGRVSKELIALGKDVVGIDWSKESIRCFQGKAIVCDIRSPWPLRCAFDGAICCEVLEHLLPEEAAVVVAHMKASVRYGFLVTVPARERLDSHTVLCQSCRRSYHIWGHTRAFHDVEEVDAMVGQPSTVRRRIGPTPRVIAPAILEKWRIRQGLYPWAPSYRCPYCGVPLPPPPAPHWGVKLLSKVITGCAFASAPLRRRSGGWFACLYEYPPSKEPPASDLGSGSE